MKFHAFQKDDAEIVASAMKIGNYEFAKKIKIHSIKDPLIKTLRVINLNVICISGAATYSRTN